MTTIKGGPHLIEFVAPWEKWNTGEVAGFERKTHDMLVQINVGRSRGIAKGSKADPAEAPSLADVVKNESSEETSSRKSISSQKASTDGGTEKGGEDEAQAASDSDDKASIDAPADDSGSNKRKPSTSRRRKKKK